MKRSNRGPTRCTDKSRDADDPTDRRRGTIRSVTILPPGPNWPGPVQTVSYTFAQPSFFAASRARYGLTWTMRLPNFPPLVVTRDRDAIRRLFTGDPLVRRHGNDLFKSAFGERSVMLLEPAEHFDRRQLHRRHCDHPLANAIGRHGATETIRSPRRSTVGCCRPRRSSRSGLSGPRPHPRRYTRRLPEREHKTTMTMHDCLITPCPICAIENRLDFPTDRPWTGDQRELKKTMEHLTILCGESSPDVERSSASRTRDRSRPTLLVALSASRLTRPYIPPTPSDYLCY